MSVDTSLVPRLETDVRPEPGYPGVAAGTAFRRDIQGLRAFAVLLVVGSHAAIAGLAGGYIGVDVFFVISGYVITQLLLREAPKGIRRGLADFYCRRIRRIVPAASATLVLTLVVAWLTLGANFDPRLAGDVKWAALFAANLRFIATGSNYFVQGIQPSLITQFWSLGVEEQFYLVFPLLVFAIAAAVRPRQRLTVLTAALAAAVALSAFWSAASSASQPVAAYYSPLTRFWELGLGCLLAVLTVEKRTHAPWLDHLAAAAGVVLLGLALLLLGDTSVYPGWLAWLPCAGAALLLWAGAGDAPTPVTRLLATRPLGYIGDISYSLYLSHYVWLMLPLQLAFLPTGWGVTALEVGGAVVTAMLSYHFLENPIRRSRRLAADGVAVALLLAIGVAASWAAATIILHAVRG